MSSSKGKLIVIDGGNGCGKSTIIKYLQETLVPTERFHFTREPGGSTLGEMIRNIMMCEDARQANGCSQFGLIWASRADHVKNTIKPKLEEGVNVITDRFESSTFAYQICGQESEDLKEAFYPMRKCALKGLEPDLYLILDVDPVVGARRVASRTGKEVTHFHDRDQKYYERIRAGYLEYVKPYSHTIIDANQGVDQVKSDSLTAVRKVLGV